MIRHPLSQSCLATHSCPESKTKLTELFKRSVNSFLLHYGHILRNCKAGNPEQRYIQHMAIMHKKFNARPFEQSVDKHSQLSSNIGR